MCTLKAVRSWLKLKATSSMPNGWLDKRKKIYNRLEELDNTRSYEVPKDEVKKELDEGRIKVEKSRKRVNLATKIKNSYEAIPFNILRREENKELQEWKSYPGLETIVQLSRNIVTAQQQPQPQQQNNHNCSWVETK